MDSILLDNNGQILILSGEGSQGTFEKFTGKRTGLAIERKLAKERCGGDRWARAYIYLHESETGPVYMDMVSGEMRNIDEEDCV